MIKDMKEKFLQRNKERNEGKKEERQKGRNEGRQGGRKKTVLTPVTSQPCLCMRNKGLCGRKVEGRLGAEALLQVQTLALQHSS